MIRPILACVSPYETAELFRSAGWNIDFSQPIESGDPLVGVSLFDNSLLLGITDGYVKDEDIQHIGCGVEIYLTVPSAFIKEIHNNHRVFMPTDLSKQPWGDLAFEVTIGEYRFMIATSEQK